MASLRAPSRVSFEQVDRSIAVGYVQYRELSAGTRPKTERISSDVNVDFDEHGNVVGIELIGVDVRSLAVAAGFAREHSLDFPHNLLIAIARGPID